MQYSYHKTFLDKLHEEEECSCCIDTHPATNATGRRRFSEKEKNRSSLILFFSCQRENMICIYIYIIFHLPTEVPLACQKKASEL